VSGVPQKKVRAKIWAGEQKERMTPGRLLPVNTGRDDWIRTSAPLFLKQWGRNYSILGKLPTSNRLLTVNRVIVMTEMLFSPA
jgi:hypothetical protein